MVVVRCRRQTGLPAWPASHALPSSQLTGRNIARPGPVAAYGYPGSAWYPPPTNVSGLTDRLTVKVVPVKLFSPLNLGGLELPNRLVMAPLTRIRSGSSGVPGDLVALHYTQRASLGLIVSEGTYPSHAGQGFPGQPGLVEPEQLAGWKAVTDSVHAAGGRIVAQVMHAGRVTHEATTGGYPVVGPSAIAITGQTRTYDGKQEYPVPHALTTEELPGIIAEFVRASKNAIGKSVV